MNVPRLLASLSVLDWATTAVALELGAREANPLMGWMFDTPLIAFLVKCLIAPVIILAAWGRGEARHHRILEGFAVGMVLVVGWNLNSILRLV